MNECEGGERKKWRRWLLDHYQVPTEYQFTEIKNTQKGPYFQGTRMILEYQAPYETCRKNCQWAFRITAQVFGRMLEKGSIHQYRLGLAKIINQPPISAAQHNKAWFWAHAISDASHQLSSTWGLSVHVPSVFNVTILISGFQHHQGKGRERLWIIRCLLNAIPRNGLYRLCWCRLGCVA